MGEPTLAEAIQQTKREIAKLTSQLVALEDAAERMKVLPVNGGKLRRSKTGIARDEIKPGSHTANAIKVLREAGKPLSVDELLKRMAESGKTPPKSSLVSALARYVNKAKIFYRPKPGIYGLLEQKGG